MEKLEFSSPTGGNVKWYAHFRKPGGASGGWT